MRMEGLRPHPWILCTSSHEWSVHCGSHSSTAAIYSKSSHCVQCYTQKSCHIKEDHVTMECSGPTCHLSMRNESVSHALANTILPRSAKLPTAVLKGYGPCPCKLHRKIQAQLLALPLPPSCHTKLKPRLKIRSKPHIRHNQDQEKARSFRAEPKPLGTAWALPQSIPATLESGHEVPKTLIRRTARTRRPGALPPT
jgi:hypothetical protein